MAYNSQNVRFRNFVISPNTQAAFGTVLADAALTRRSPLLDPAAFATLTKQFWSDANYTGKGHDWPTVRSKTQQDVAFQQNTPVTAWLAGWLAAFGLGAVTTTGAGPNYTHTCKFIQAANQPPITTIYTEDTADVKTKWLDMAITKASFTGPANGPLMCNYSMVGSGHFADGAMTTLPTLPTEALILGSDTDILIGAPGSAASIKDRVRSWQVDIDNALEVKRSPGGGMYAANITIGAQRPTLKMTVAAKDADDLRGFFINDTLLEVQINTNSGAAAIFNIKFPGLYLSAAPMGVDGKEIVYQLETDQNSVIKSGANDPIEIDVTNAQTAYLAAPA